MSLGLIINALKFLSNPVVLLSVLLAGSLAFGGCQSKRIKGLKADVAEYKAAAVKFKAEVETGRNNLKVVNRQLEIERAKLAELEAHVATLRAELAKAQEVRARIEADHKRALAAQAAAKVDAERTLATFMERYARATRNPDCQAVLETLLCR